MFRDTAPTQSRFPVFILLSHCERCHISRFSIAANVPRNASHTALATLLLHAPPTIHAIEPLAHYSTFSNKSRIACGRRCWLPAPGSVIDAAGPAVSIQSLSSVVQFVGKREGELHIHPPPCTPSINCTGDSKNNYVIILTYAHVEHTRFP